MESFFYGQTCYEMLLSADEMGGVSVWSIPICEPVPVVQFPVMSFARYFVVLSGSVIFETETERTFTVNKNEDLFVPASTRAYIKNAGGPVQSKLLMNVSGWGFERFIAATAAAKPGSLIPDDLAEVGQRFGVAVQQIEAPQAPELGKWLMPRPQSHYVAL